MEDTQLCNGLTNVVDCVRHPATGKGLALKCMSIPPKVYGEVPALATQKLAQVVVPPRHAGMTA